MNGLMFRDLSKKASSNANRRVPGGVKKAKA